jgi:hypothetical protein
MPAEPPVSFGGQRIRPLWVTQTGVVWKLAREAAAGDEIQRGRGPCNAELKGRWSRTVLRWPLGELWNVHQTCL